MSSINLLPETLKTKRQQKVLSQKAFLISFIFLALSLILTLTILTYEQMLKNREVSLQQQIKSEENLIQSFKETEGSYRLLKAKVNVLAEVLDQRNNQAEILTQIKSLAVMSNVRLSGFSLDSSMLELIGASSDYSSLAIFLEKLTVLNKPLQLKKSTFKSLTQDEQVGEIEFIISSEVAFSR